MLSLITERSLTHFVIASILLAIIPGPGITFIIAGTLSHGPAAQFVSISSIAFGNLGNAIAASIGLAVILSTSSTVFAIVRFVGAVYPTLLAMSIRGRLNIHHSGNFISALTFIGPGIYSLLVSNHTTRVP